MSSVMAEPAAWHGKNLQVHGIVVPDSIARKPDSLEWRFDLQRNGKVLRTYYTGIVPATFKAESEVVLKGRLTSDGTFHVDKDGVMAKCPSKYDPAKLPAATSGAALPSTGTK